MIVAEFSSFLQEGSAWISQDEDRESPRGESLNQVYVHAQSCQHVQHALPETMLHRVRTGEHITLLAPCSSVIKAFLIATTTRFSCSRLVQRLTSLLHQEIHERKCRQGVSPPPAKEPVEQQPCQQRQRHVRTRHTAGGIGSQSGAPNAFGDPELALPQQGHDDGSGDGQTDAPPGSLGLRPGYESESAVAHDVDGEREQTDGRHKGAARFGTLNALGRTAALLDLQAPQQNATRNEFNNAVQAKALQGDAARRKPDREGHASLDDHPDDGHQFNPYPQAYLPCAGRHPYSLRLLDVSKWPCH